MSKIIAVLVLAVLLTAPALAIESTQFAVQNLWWTVTLCDTVAAGDFNYWDLTGSVVEVGVFTSDQPGSLVWWNTPDAAIYNAPTSYWLFNASEDVTITAKGGIDTLEVHNTGSSAAANRLIGQRR